MNPFGIGEEKREQKICLWKFELTINYIVFLCVCAKISFFSRVLFMTY